LIAPVFSVAGLTFTVS